MLHKAPHRTASDDLNSRWKFKMKRQQLLVHSVIFRSSRECAHVRAGNSEKLIYLAVRVAARNVFAASSWFQMRQTCNIESSAFFFIHSHSKIWLMIRPMMAVRLCNNRLNNCLRQCGFVERKNRIQSHLLCGVPWSVSVSKVYPVAHVCLSTTIIHNYYILSLWNLLYIRFSPNERENVGTEIKQRKKTVSAWL